jgi:Cytochrome c554 and c-prime
MDTRGVSMKKTYRSGTHKNIIFWLVGLGVVIGTAGLLSLTPLGCQKAAPPDERDTHDPASPDSTKVPKVPDKGFVLIITGNWAGQIEPCGCSERQLGGIDRRSRVLQSVPPKNRLLLDAGPLIDRDDRQSQLKLEAFLHSMQQLKYDALALTGREVGILKQNLGLDPKQRPATIATNLPENIRQDYGVIGYFEKTLQRNEKKLDCLVFAVSDPRPIADSHLGQQLNLRDPVEAVVEFLVNMKIAPVQPHKEKLIILLVSSSDETLVKKLRNIRALDLIVKVGFTDEPEIAEPAGWLPPVMTSGRLGKYVAGFNLPTDADATLTNAKFFAIPIEEFYPRDPSIVQFIDKYQLQMQIENLIGNEDLLPRRPAPDGLQFVGNSACADCHDEVNTKWKKFKHGHALDTLEHVNRQFDPECVSCHTVGMRYVSGFLSREKTPDLAHVGCESCHGPGSAHIENPDEKYQMIFTACQDCHDHETSPSFEFEREKYLEQIRHWPEPRRFWK